MATFFTEYPFLTEPPNVIAAVLLILAVIVALVPEKPWVSRIRRKALLTANEKEFFHRLQRALSAYHVFPQVPFAALLTDDGKLSRSARWKLRAKFDRKIADFVICDRGSLQVVAIIELDDRTHDANADRQRDAITKAVGYQTFRFQSKEKPSEAEIAALFPQVRPAWG